MKDMQIKNVTNNKKSILVISTFLLTTTIFILLDIPVLRILFGFAFYSIIPGVLILNILNLDALKMTTKFVLSWGLSITFLMLVSLILNFIYPLFGYFTPLSKNSLVISLTITLSLLLYANFRRTNINFFIALSDFTLNSREKIFLIIPAFFPFLGIFGMHIMNTTNNNTILMILYISIIIYTIFISVMHGQVPESVYAPIIFLTSISLVLLWALRSNHILGVDVHSEYYIFQQTLQSGRWQIIFNNTLDSCLSISILPTVYQSFLGIEPEYTFKILYSALFSVSPLVIYIIIRKYLICNYAYLASLFFMSQQSFLLTGSGPRTRLAVLFFSLALMVLFSEELNDINRRLLFMIFTLSCIVSHYSTTYIFFIVLLGSWIGMQIIRKMRPFSSAVTSNDARFLFKFHLTTGLLIFVFGAIFLWYSQITDVAFDDGVRYIDRSLRSLQDFFVLELRREDVQDAMGKGLESKGILEQINFIFSWLTIVLIAIGVFTTLAKYRQRIAQNNACGKEGQIYDFMLQRLDVDFFILSLTCSALLVISIALPYALKGYSMQRMFFQMMVVLSLFFVIGGVTVAKSIRVSNNCYLIVLVVLIPFFSYTTGVVYQIFDNPKSIILNSGENQFDMFYVYDQETFGARWLKYYALEDADIYTDFLGGTRLVSQGGLLFSTYPAMFIEDFESLGEGYIYFRYAAVVSEKLLDSKYNWHNLTDYEYEFATRDLMYDNGGSEVWK